MWASIVAAVAGPVINVLAKYALAWLATYEVKAQRADRAAASLQAAQIIAAKVSNKAAADALDKGGV